MRDLDKLSESVVRGLARMNSRRGVLATIGGLITGARCFRFFPSRARRALRRGLATTA